MKIVLSSSTIIVVTCTILMFPYVRLMLFIRCTSALHHTIATDIELPIYYVIRCTECNSYYGIGSVLAISIPNTFRKETKG